MNDELKFRLALHFMKGIGPVTARSLIGYCGSIENIFKTKKRFLEKIPGIGKERANLIDKNDLFEMAEAEMEFMSKNNIKPLFYLDDDYPVRLKNCDDAPIMFFFKGNSELNSGKMIAIVGTRYITPYGRQMTDALVEALIPYRVTVISGLAYGVDVQAHKAALRNGITTIGVVAHGLDRIYPSENGNVAREMLSNGGLISEYRSKTRPDRENFPARNRIVAGMSDAVIVIESAEKGGALITAEFANEYNRDVFALPGRTTDHYSRGCNKIIRENKAMLFDDPLQIPELLGWNDGKVTAIRKHQLDLFTTLSEQEKFVADILTNNGMLGIDELAQRCQMAVSKASSVLLNLEFAGVVRSLPGKMYEVI